MRTVPFRGDSNDKECACVRANSPDNSATRKVKDFCLIQAYFWGCGGFFVFKYAQGIVKALKFSWKKCRDYCCIHTENIDLRYILSTSKFHSLSYAKGCLSITQTCVNFLSSKETRICRHQEALHGFK